MQSIYGIFIKRNLLLVVDTTEQLRMRVMSFLRDEMVSVPNIYILPQHVNNGRQSLRTKLTNANIVLCNDLFFIFFPLLSLTVSPDLLQTMIRTKNMLPTQQPGIHYTSVIKSFPLPAQRVDPTVYLFRR
jgi:hypothetical protein